MFTSFASVTKLKLDFNDFCSGNIFGCLFLDEYDASLGFARQ